MTEKLPEVKYLSKLFKIIGEIPMSENTDLKISCLLKNLDFPEKESMARVILEKIQGCNTEQEVVQALGLSEEQH